MTRTLQYLALAALLTVAASLPSGVNEVDIGELEDDIRGTGSLRQINLGNTTTSTSKPGSSKYTYCALEVWNNELYFTSPNFPSNYPNNADCSLGGGGGPALAQFVFQPFELQNKNQGKCVDYLNFTLPYGVGKTFCGTQTGKKFKFPTYNYVARFISDASIVRAGFNITIDFLTSPCHQWSTLYNLGDYVEYQTPNYPSVDTEKNRMCEYIVSANNGYRVQVDFLGFDLKLPCKSNNVVVNLQNEWNYPKDTSSRYCGNSLPPSMTSTYEQAHVVYQAKKKNKGFKVRFTAV